MKKRKVVLKVNAVIQSIISENEIGLISMNELRYVAAKLSRIFCGVNIKRRIMNPDKKKN